MVGRVVPPMLTVPNAQISLNYSIARIQTITSMGFTNILVYNSLAGVLLAMSEVVGRRTGAGKRCICTNRTEI